MIGTENLEEKLSQVLNDPNSMAQLMSFAQSLGMGPPDAPPPPGPPPGRHPARRPATTPSCAASCSSSGRRIRRTGRRRHCLRRSSPICARSGGKRLDRAMRIARISQIAGGALKQHGGLLGGPNDV